MGVFKDLTGARFGRLTVIRERFPRNKQAFWECRCDCGKTTVVRSAYLSNGNTKSCGCLKVENNRTIRVTHGRRYSATYSSWASMLNRCNNSHEGYESIDVCERWRTFENFLADMGERPNGTTIDRVDGNKGYYKDNCRWATPTQQRRNQRSRVLSPDIVREMRRRHGAGEPIKRIAATFGVNSSTVNNVISGRTWGDID